MQKKIVISSALSAHPGEKGEHSLNDKIDDENDGGYSQRPGHAGLTRQLDRIDDDKNQQDRSGEKIDVPQNVVSRKKRRMERITKHHRRIQERMQQSQDA